VKKLPIGISDYKKIVEEEYSYVDKTLFIQEVIQLGAEVILIPRPRRFGKTSNLSMLRYFFEHSEKNLAYLFQHFAIWKTPYREEQGKYPVIFLSLKRVKNRTWEQAYEGLKLIIMREFERFQFLITACFSEGKKAGYPLLSDTEKMQFQCVLDGSASQTLFTDSLKMITLWLERYYQRKVIVLIDEYDTPIHAAYLHAYYEPMIDFMREWLTEGLKDNPCLQKAVLTGILRIGKESIFSGLNNPGCYTVLEEEFCDKFGLLEEEVMLLLQEHKVSYQIEEIRSWYNGYHIGSCSVYNPWSILECIQKKGEIKPYWVNTSDNELIKDLLIQGHSSVKKDLERLLIGESITKSIHDTIALKNLANDAQTVFGLFLFSGYLTLAKRPVYENGALQCELQIPNREVHALYTSIVTDWMTYITPGHDLPALLNSLTQGDVVTFSAMLRELTMQSMSFYDIMQGEPERVYHAFVLGLLVTLAKTHEVKSNRESGFGRYDICIIPKCSSLLGIVIEFKKVVLEKDLEKGALEALEQIEQRHYAKEIQSRGITKILLLGIAFYGKNLAIKEKVM